MRDVGLIGDRTGWKLIFGGNTAAAPCIGDPVAEHLDDAQVLNLIQKCLAVYSEHAEGNIRSARFIEQFGIRAFKEKVLAK